MAALATALFCPTATAATYMSSSYGPPWGGIQGGGITRTGIDLSRAPAIRGVAVDPAVIPLGSLLDIQPNPFGTRKPFRAFDTGGAIRGRRIDFYDWRGRSAQFGWGRRPVTVYRLRLVKVAKFGQPRGP